MKPELTYLVVEDSLKVCEGIRDRMAEFPDWELDGFAHHVEDAREMVMAKKPALVFLDWSLKGGSAYEVLQAMQEIKDFYPYIIFNTGYQNENPEIPQEIINRYQVDKYIVKPVFENLRLHLADYLKEAKEKRLGKAAKKPQYWLDDMAKTRHRVNPEHIICICQNPSDARSRILYLDEAPGQLVIPYTWEKCISLLSASGRRYFVSKARESVVVKDFIESFDKPFIRCHTLAFKIEVTKEKIREFETWLLEQN